MTETLRPYPWEDFPQHTLETWKENAQKVLKNTPLERLTKHTPDSLSRPPLAPPYLPQMDTASAFATSLQANRSSQGGWAIHQRYTHPNPQILLRDLQHDLQHGTQAVWIDASALVSVPYTASLQSICALFDGQQIPLYLDAGTDAFAFSALRIAAAQHASVDLSSLRGGWCLDPLGEAVAKGSLVGGLERAQSTMQRLVQWSQRNTPQMRALRVSALPYHNAGASAPQEVAALIATATTYLRWLCEAEISIEDAAQQMLFDLPVTCDTFAEIAKLRATRVLWSRVLSHSLGQPAPLTMHLHARTSPRVLTRRDAWVNLLRSTATTFAASVGGAQSIECAPFDAALQIPDAFSQRIARNTQVILQEESHLGHVVDPAGGSDYVEHLTEQIAQAAWSLFQSIESQGGLPTALEQGSLQQQIHEIAHKRSARIAQRKDLITGVSAYPFLQEKPPQTHPIDLSTLQTRQTSALQQHLQQHPQDQIAHALPPSLEASDTSKLSDTLIHSLVHAAHQGATLDTLQHALFKGPAWFIPKLDAHRDAERFEALRDASDLYLEQHGQRPRIFLVNLGPIPQHRPRADFARQLFEAGGFEAIDNDGFSTPDEALQAYKDAHTPTAILCSTDAAYAEMIPQIAPLLKAAGVQHLYLAGKPAEQEAAWRSAGIDHFVFLGCDACATLEALQQALHIRTHEGHNHA